MASPRPTLSTAVVAFDQTDSHQLWATCARYKHGFGLKDRNSCPKILGRLLLCRLHCAQSVQSKVSPRRLVVGSIISIQVHTYKSPQTEKKLHQCFKFDEIQNPTGRERISQRCVAYFLVLVVLSVLTCLDIKIIPRRTNITNHVQFRLSHPRISPASRATHEKNQSLVHMYNSSQRSNLNISLSLCNHKVWSTAIELETNFSTSISPNPTHSPHTWRPLSEVQAPIMIAGRRP